ncbi:hypothetical protein [Geodermatophilus sp. DSM 45219]|uniref:hypothetical protein n=1 Tax=Geodermatophilus sp. DSM 45219 TaxID=1881103 RepID=UPI00088A86AC|nr:hypothetical protein [Geodermatophilus sp. DSM 45219]SDN79974.1 ADP-heptose:LPS heptosyltransferase [Geodermatophilus sp. DSM 45219]
MTERFLVDFFYAQQLGHAIEALQYCVGHAAAVPGREVSVLLNAATPTELATWCPAVSAVFPVAAPFLEPDPHARERLAGVPRDWDRVVDDTRRHQPFQLDLFPGMRDHYAASDAHLRPRTGRSVVGADRAGYLPHQPVRLDLPVAAREAATRRLGGDARPRIAVLPAGSSDPSLYPSVGSWRLVLDALAAAVPGLQLVLLGRLARDERSSTSWGRDDVDALLAHRSHPVDCVDVPLAEQLAVVEACDILLAPHSGFGMAALAVGTPWLALSGGRWFEYWSNSGVPFRSVLPDLQRYPAFSQFDPADVVVDGDDGPRTPSMTRARVREDLDRLVAAARELLAGDLTHEQALRDYHRDLRAAVGGDAVWSIDGVHAAYP